MMDITLLWRKILHFQKTNSLRECRKTPLLKKSLVLGCHQTVSTYTRPRKPLVHDDAGENINTLVSHLLLTFSALSFALPHLPQRYHNTTTSAGLMPGVPSDT